MKRKGYILFFLGLSLLIAILLYYGIRDVMSALAAAGWGLILVAASHLLPLFMDSHAWRLLFTGRRVPPVMLLIYCRWIGEAINSLLPAAQIGGDMVRARLLAVRGYPVPEAGASVFVEVTIALLSQLVFTLIGIGCLLALGGHEILFHALCGFCLFLALVALFVVAQRRGFWARLVNLLAVFVGRERLSDLAGNAEALDQAIRDIYGARKRVAISFAWRLAGWIAGATEVWLALWFMGTDPSILEAVLLESLGHVIRGIAFLVPGAYGVQEGGFVFLGSMVGLSPDIALSMSLAKRFRELALGIPALLCWQAEEGRVFFKKMKGGKKS